MADWFYWLYLFIGTDFTNFWIFKLQQNSWPMWDPDEDPGSKYTLLDHRVHLLTSLLSLPLSRWWFSLWSAASQYASFVIYWTSFCLTGSSMMMFCLNCVTFKLIVWILFHVFCYKSVFLCKPAWKACGLVQETNITNPSFGGFLPSINFTKGPQHDAASASHRIRSLPFPLLRLFLRSSDPTGSSDGFYRK